MSNRRSRRYHDLPECPICGMDSGKRMMTNHEPAQFFVVCEVCGFRTKPCNSQGAATQNWGRYKRTRNSSET